MPHPSLLAQARLIAHVLDTGRHVLVSDSDVVWRHDPTSHFERLRAGGATIAAATDCLDVAADRDKTPRPTSPNMCGHSPGNGPRRTAVFNTGILWFGATAVSTTFARRWASETLALTDPWSDDQGVFNRLLTGSGVLAGEELPSRRSSLYPVKAAGLNGGEAPHAHAHPHCVRPPWDST